MKIEVTQFKYREGDLLACVQNPYNEPEFEIGALYEVLGANVTPEGDTVYALKTAFDGKIVYSVDNKFMRALTEEEDEMVIQPDVSLAFEGRPKTLGDIDTRTWGDKPDMVNHPSHYTMGKYEVIDVIEDVTQHLHGFQAVLVGNILKYVMRYNFKNGIEDLKKARFYLNKLIEKLEK